MFTKKLYIENKNNELVTKLVDMFRYSDCGSDEKTGDYLAVENGKFFFCSDDNLKEMRMTGFYQCPNEDVFIGLAALRDDTSKMQLFVCDKTKQGTLFSHCKPGDLFWWTCGFEPETGDMLGVYYHKASDEEIVDYYTNDNFTCDCVIFKNSPELIEKLKDMGRIVNSYDTFEGNYIICTGNYFITSSIVDMDQIRLNFPDVVDCGTDEKLFLALAALRNNNDYMQWFRVYDEDGSDCRLCDEKSAKEKFKFYKNAEKMTKEDIIYKFKRDTEAIKKQMEGLKKFEDKINLEDRITEIKDSDSIFKVTDLVFDTEESGETIMKFYFPSYISVLDIENINDFVKKLKAYVIVKKLLICSGCYTYSIGSSSYMISVTYKVK